MGRYRSRQVIVLVLVALAAAGARADVVRGMSAERIREAIAWGETAPEGALEQYDLHHERSFVVNFDTPFLRVAQLARAMKTQNGSLEGTDLSPKVTAEALNLYVHARYEPGPSGEDSSPEVEYVTISRPGASDALAQVVMPLAFQSYVRRVPTPADYDGPTRLARSVKAVFPLSALSPDAQVKIRFHGGATQVLKLDPALLARVR